MADVTWREFLGQYSQGDDALFDSEFVERWGNEHWSPNDEDKKAAAILQVQMISRITTQRLGYLEGVEKTALKSVYDLFDHTRTICTANCGARHFCILAWHLLNTHVRPFTAKWHLASERGMLSALDTTDEFRADLEGRQKLLRRFEALLAHIRDGKAPPAGSRDESELEKSIVAEMGGSLLQGIPPTKGGIDAAAAKIINQAEEEAIRQRRRYYDPTDTEKIEKEHAIGLALSGGGIRSATLSLGVLIALAKRGLLPQFDYVSTVSGGGYLGSFLTAFLNSPAERLTTSAIGLRYNELPFQSEGGEAEALRHIRHHSKYLASGKMTDRLRMIAAQLYGMVLNGVGVMFIAAIFGVAEQYLRATNLPYHVWPEAIVLISVLLAVWAFIALVLGRHGQRSQKVADMGLVSIGTTLCALFAWVGLGRSHEWVASEHHWPVISGKQLLAILGAIPLISSAFAGVAGKIWNRVKLVLAILSAIAAPLFFFGIYLLLYRWMESAAAVFTIGGFPVTWIHISMVVLAIIYFALIDVNVSSPHRHYRNKLAEAYLIQPAENPKPGKPFDEAVELKLSNATSPRGPYHLINAALNVPGSKNPAMQGRLTDFFLFSRAFCGSPLTGYRRTTEWEEKDGHLDLGTAMAISGAAAAPQMGLGTRRRLSFWLALLNVRLGYWVRNPGKRAWPYGTAPGLWFLLKEMLGSMDERTPWIYVSDGGHIENLGVYELLRRRCKYIVAIDGEQDQRMTFGALTNLQRLAAIDLGVTIHINLDDLRLNEQGFSRSHFRFARVEYPGKHYGYLLYVKSSLTGNEGEFLRRYRIDDPAFPHDPTADQFFSEPRFEAYRSLGEHMGDKLFLRALVGTDLAKSHCVQLETWFSELGKRLLEPL